MHIQAAWSGPLLTSRSIYRLEVSRDQRVTGLNRLPMEKADHDASQSLVSYGSCKMNQFIQNHNRIKLTDVLRIRKTKAYSTIQQINENAKKKKWKRNTSSSYKKRWKKDSKIKTDVYNYDHHFTNQWKCIFSYFSIDTLGQVTPHYIILNIKRDQGALQRDRILSLLWCHGHYSPVFF